MRFKRIVGWFAVTLLTVASTTWGATLVLKDGTVLEGTVIKTSDGYWIKTPDGNSRIVSNADVQSASLASADDANSGSATSDDGSEAFRLAHSRADDAQSALAAVSIWQQFIDKYPGNPDLATAQQELDRWKKLAAEGAEKINGVWIGGEARKKIIAQAEDLTRQGMDMLAKNQTLEAVDVLQQSVKLYPNSFITNFELGMISLDQTDFDQAAEYYMAAYRLKPQSAAAANNLAVANCFRKRFDIAIAGFIAAAKIEDNKDIAQNLVNAMYLAPSDLRTAPQMKPTLQAMTLLATKYDIQGPTADYTLMRLEIPKNRVAPNLGTQAGSLTWSGTGFFISDDGLILTNRHVAQDSKTLLVLLPDGTQASADIVSVDDKFDLALIRIKTSHKVPYLQFSAADSPNEGADCVVMGFPMIDQLGGDLKVTRGIVSSAEQDHGSGADVLTDAKVNPGNSGGPIINKFGNVMAIVCMKSLTSGEFDSYGIGISAGHVREFLQRNHVDFTSTADTGSELSTEDLVAKVKPATVCILATN